MAMGNCNKCFSNSWSYKHIDNWIIANCIVCEAEVEFEAIKKKNEQSEWFKSKKCQGCGGLIEKREKKHITKPNKQYHYGTVWRCTGKLCRRLYVLNKDKCECDRLLNKIF